MAYGDPYDDYTYKDWPEKEKPPMQRVVSYTTTMTEHDGEKVVWHCYTCREAIVHEHKPVKPTYEDLVQVIDVLQDLYPTIMAEDVLKRAREGR